MKLTRQNLRRLINESLGERPLDDEEVGMYNTIKKELENAYRLIDMSVNNKFASGSDLENKFIPTLKQLFELLGQLFDINFIVDMSYSRLHGQNRIRIYAQSDSASGLKQLKSMFDLSPFLRFNEPSSIDKESLFQQGAKACYSFHCSGLLSDGYRYYDPSKEGHKAPNADWHTPFKEEYKQKQKEILGYDPDEDSEEY